MSGTYKPTGTEVKNAFNYRDNGRNILDQDFSNSTRLLDQRSQDAAQTKLQSDYLNDITESDSRYMQNTRLNAMEGAAARGQFNSSIGVGAAERQAIDAANVIAEGDARVGMANTLATNTRRNKEYDAFSDLNRASYDNKTGMLSDSIDAANLFNQNDMAAMIAKGDAFDTQQYGLENKEVDQINFMAGKAQDQANSLINKRWDQQYNIDTKELEQKYGLINKEWDQQYNIDTKELEQKYGMINREDEWKYEAKDLDLRQKYQLEQDRANHTDQMELDAKKYANDGFMESLRQFGGLEQQFISGYAQIQASEIPASQKETQIRLLYNQKQGSLNALTGYAAAGGSGGTYTGGGTGGYNTSGVEETYKPGETVIQRDMSEVNTQINDIYSKVRVGGGMDSEEESLIDGYRDAVAGLNDAELREVIVPYSQSGLTNENWEDVVVDMGNIALAIKKEKEENSGELSWDERMDYM